MRNPIIKCSPTPYTHECEKQRNVYISMYTVASVDTKILLVKDYVCKKKDRIHVKIKVSTCAKFVVGHFELKKKNQWFDQFQCHSTVYLHNLRV